MYEDDGMWKHIRIERLWLVDLELGAGRTMLSPPSPLTFFAWAQAGTKWPQSGISGGFVSNGAGEDFAKGSLDGVEWRDLAANVAVADNMAFLLAPFRSSALSHETSSKSIETTNIKVRIFRSNKRTRG